MQIRSLRQRLALFAGAFLFAAMASAGGEFVAGMFQPGEALPTDGEATRYGTGWAVPLKTPAPAWYTDELRERVRTADGVPVPAPAGAPRPEDAGVRPGAWMIEPHGCTMNFVFRHYKELAIGTAGHCVDHVGQSVVLLVLDPASGEPVLVNVGWVSLMRDGGIGDDFALVSIRSPLHNWVSGGAAVIGGPCGMYTEAGAPETLVYYGHGAGLDRDARPRAGSARAWRTSAFGWDSVSALGDSGSPVRVTDFSAAGLLTHLVLDEYGQPTFVAGTRIGKIMRLAPEWALVDSPHCLT